MAESNRSTGTVKWFSAQKGFGFIAPDDGGEDLFVHQTSIRSDGFRTLSEGQVVEFVIDYGEDGRTKAVDVANLTRSPRRSGFGRGRGGAGAGAGAERGDRGRGGGYGGYGGGGYNTGSRGGRSSGGGGGECYNCGRMGHLARDCYQSSSGDGVGGGASGGGGARRYGGGGRGYGGGGGGGRGCYNCGEEGHLARECPNDQK